MEVPEREALLTYIKDAISLESSILKQEQIVSSVRENYNEIKPSKHLMDTPAEPRINYVPIEDYQVNGLIIFFLSMGIIIGLIGIYMVTTIGNLFITEGVFLGFILTIIMLGCIGIGIISVRFLIKLLGRKKEWEKKNQLAQEEYQSALNDYKAKCKEINIKNAAEVTKFENNYSKWLKSQNETLGFLNSSLTKTKTILHSLYNKGVIYDKYQNLPALTTIYEYLVTGRAEELAGPHGAYNLYEDEVRKDTIIAQLNTVINSLEQIKQNQFMLYKEIKEIQSQLHTIKSEISTVRDYTVTLTKLTALNTFYASVSAENARISTAYLLTR